MDSVTHFELPADDRKRAIGFYSKAFGWNLKQMGAEMGDYVLAHTTETDANGMTKQVGAINGGIYQRSKETSGHPSVVIQVKDLKKTVKLIEKNGGKIVGEPQEIPGVGLWVSFVDTEKNRLSVMQPTRQ